MKWFRLYTEIRRDPKLRRLPVSYRWVWITVLCMARESPRPGWLLLRKNMPAQPADIADEANVPLDDAARAIELFMSGSYEMLAEEGGVLRVINWGKRQFENDSSVARTRRYRERLNRGKSDPAVRPRCRDAARNVTGDVTRDGHCDVTCDVSESSQFSAPHASGLDNDEGLAGCGSDDPQVESSFSSRKSLSHAVLQVPSPEERHSDTRCDVTGDVTRDDGCDVTGNVTGDVTLQSYRDICKTIEIKDIRESIISASEGSEEPTSASVPPTLSAPDGAENSHFLSLDEGSGEGRKNPVQVTDTELGETETSAAHEARDDGSLRESPTDIVAPGNEHGGSSCATASASKMVDICDATLQTANPVNRLPVSTDDLEASRKEPAESLPGPRCEMQRNEIVQKGAIQAPSPLDHSPGATGTPSAVPAKPKVYLSKRKRKLSDWKLETFDEFMAAFAHKKGRAEAADAWLDIPNLTPDLAARIIKAAGKEAAARAALVAKGISPKWPQGWITARRWEDWEDDAREKTAQSKRQEMERKSKEEAVRKEAEEQQRYDQARDSFLHLPEDDRNRLLKLAREGNPLLRNSKQEFVEIAAVTIFMEEQQRKNDP